MRIALFHDLPSGGAKRVLHEQARRLRARGHVVEAFLPDTADETYLPLADAVDAVHRFRRPVPPDRARLLSSRVALLEPARWLGYMRHIHAAERQVAQAIDGGAYDLVLVHPSQFTQAPLLLRMLRTPSLYYCHELMRAAYEPWFTRAWLRFALRQTLGRIDRSNARAATRIAVNSEFIAARVDAAYQRDAVVVSPGVDSDRFRPLGRARGRFALAVGALHRSKGLRFLIDSVARLEAAVRPPLVLVADRGREDERRHLTERAAATGVQLVIRERVTEEELIPLYNEAAVVVYAPHDEPLGLVPLEAMACATPVVAVAEGGVTETVVAGVTGLLTQRDAHAFADALRSLVLDPSRATEMGRAGREHITTHWSWQLSIDRLEALCSNTVRSVREGAAGT